MQIRFLTRKFKEVDYSFHRIVELEVMRIKNTFMKAELLIYQQNVKRN